MDPDSSDLSQGGPKPRVARRGQVGVDDPASDIFFAVIETTRLPMVLSDPNRPDNPIVFANGAFCRATGYARSEIVGRNCRFLQGPDSDPETLDLIRQALRARSEVAVELLNYRKDGTSFWNALFISPVFDAGGDLVYFFASQLDVSRRRDAEEALRRARKMEAVGQLAVGFAHDFNNLLQVITGNMDRLRDHAASSGDARLIRQVGAVSAAADRATSLTRTLLAASREQAPEGRSVDLNGLVAGLSDRLDGEPGRGTTVRVSVPAARGADDASRSSGGRATHRGGGERILVVDDRAEVAELARTMLEDVGYAVDVAKDGQEALAKLRVGFDLLFSDVVMPGSLDGIGLAREAQRRHPTLKVLLTTGLADPAIERADAGVAGFDAIVKPYRRAELARRIRAVLDGAATIG